MNIGATVAQGPWHALYEFLQLLRTAGWVVTAASDGVASFSTNPATAGTILTSGSTGAGGLRNIGAWFAIRSPDGANALCVQTGRVDIFSTDLDARIKWSPGGTFSTGGSPGLTRTPAVTGGAEAFIRGGGTDAAPTYATLFYRYLNTATVFGAATDTAPYVFWTFHVAVLAANPMKGGIALESLTHTNVGDVHPYVWVTADSEFGKATTGVANDDNPPAGPQPGFVGSAGGACWYPSTTAPTAIVQMPLAYIYPTVDYLADPISGVDLLTPAVCVRTRQPDTNPWIGPGIWKGVCQNLLWTGRTTKAIGDTVSAGGTRNYIYALSLALPWDGSVPVFF